MLHTFTFPYSTVDAHKQSHARDRIHVLIQCSCRTQCHLQNQSHIADFLCNNDWRASNCCTTRSAFYTTNRWLQLCQQNVTVSIMTENTKANTSMVLVVLTTDTIKNWRDYRLAKNISKRSVPIRSKLLSNRITGYCWHTDLQNTNNCSPLSKQLTH